MTKDQLIQQVALRMDEITPDSGLSGITVDGRDNNPLYELIGGIIDDGVLELFSIASYFRLPQKEFTNIALENAGSQRTINDGQGTISARKMIRLRVPDDFLRVAEINHTSFQRPITEVVPEQSEQGKRQHNPFLMAKEARPVGVMSHGVWSSEQAREIDCYSVPSSVSSATGVVATYIAKPASCSDTSAWTSQTDPVPTTLKPALEWLIASRAFGARGDSSHAEICQQNAQNLLV